MASREAMLKAKEDGELLKVGAFTMNKRLHATQKKIEASLASERGVLHTEQKGSQRGGANKPKSGSCHLSDRRCQGIELRTLEIKRSGTGEGYKVGREENCNGEG
ncbi:hypothetical protein IFM89_035830 [Coptis chinensis]|uniref:Uncharacterized protein n=1 Tax=Coptis chinensis TaxID=261450 RepID=A0A835LU38_9MAGN|nr:hypothetical protein IFM89_035830 [Coptis chinensis]